MLLLIIIITKDIHFHRSSDAMHSDDGLDPSYSSSVTHHAGRKKCGLLMIFQRALAVY
jgi:hypothetical protein